MEARTFATAGSLVFLFLAPGTVAGLVPFWLTRWRFRRYPGSEFGRAAAILLIVAGLAVLLESFWRFGAKGLGTPMPLMPTRHLVVSGLYRHMRNPMYVAVASLIAGQALLFGDLRLLTYAACVWAAFHLFVLLYEEPTLMKAYPQEYPVFRENVPRWIPRIHPWRGDHVPSA